MVQYPIIHPSFSTSPTTWLIAAQHARRKIHNSTLTHHGCVWPLYFLVELYLSTPYGHVTSFAARSSEAPSPIYRKFYLSHDIIDPQTQSYHPGAGTLELRLSDIPDLLHDS
jgi:hypothetical protein